MGDATGDSVAVSGNASGAGGDDVIDLGEDGGTIAIGDHSASGGTAVGSGNDLLFGDNIDQNTRSVPGVGGIDSIDGGAGDDILRGGPNADFLNGNTGRDDCDGEQGTDVEINCEI
ncbi:calcium-binding protein [Streptomyces mirabilis]|uniref:calcium-binding protein n=1 Tax=Streptomyces mirabilis TaxID=68239 RepID=UPI0036A25F03